MDRSVGTLFCVVIVAPRTAKMDMEATSKTRRRCASAKWNHAHM